MNHYMLDLETLGNGHNGAIVAIGVCAFDPAQGRLEEEQEFWQGKLDERGLLKNEQPHNYTGPNFYRRISLSASKQPGVIEASNVEWWLEQDREAQRELLGEGRVPLEDALCQLNTWLSQRMTLCKDDDRIKLWSKPPTFDERLLREAYERNNWAFPWHFRAGRCMRTFVDLARELGLTTMDREQEKEARGTARHNAINDARWQAAVVCNITQAMRKR